jgi:hypothetical protein
MLPLPVYTSFCEQELQYVSVGAQDDSMYVNKADEKAYAMQQNQAAFTVICYLWSCYIFFGRA